MTAAQLIPQSDCAELHSVDVTESSWQLARPLAPSSPTCVVRECIRSCLSTPLTDLRTPPERKTPTSLEHGSLDVA